MSKRYGELIRSIEVGEVVEDLKCLICDGNMVKCLPEENLTFKNEAVNKFIVVCTDCGKVEHFADIHKKDNNNTF